MNSFSVNNYSAFNTPYSYYNGSYSAPYWQGQQVYYTEPENNGADNAAKTVGLAAMLQALAIGIQKGSQWFAKKLEAGKEFTSSENVHKIANSMIKRNNLDVTVDYITPQNRERYQPNPGLYNELEAVVDGVTMILHRDGREGRIDRGLHDDVVADFREGLDGHREGRAERGHVVAMIFGNVEAEATLAPGNRGLFKAAFLDIRVAVDAELGELRHSFNNGLRALEVRVGNPHRQHALRVLQPLGAVRMGAVDDFVKVMLQGHF